MRISSFTVYGHSNGSAILDIGDNDHMHMTFTDEESAQLRALAQRIIEARQSSLAAAITQPFVALADYSEA
jgi:hypothetical protein